MAIKKKVDPSRSGASRSNPISLDSVPASDDPLITTDGEADGWRILFWAKPGDREGACLPSPQPFISSTFHSFHSPHVLIQHHCAGCRSATANASAAAAANDDLRDSTSADDPWGHASVLRAFLELNGPATTQEVEEEREQRCEESVTKLCVCVREVARGGQGPSWSSGRLQLASVAAEDVMLHMVRLRGRGARKGKADEWMGGVGEGEEKAEIVVSARASDTRELHHPSAVQALLHLAQRGFVTVTPLGIDAPRGVTHAPRITRPLEERAPGSVRILLGVPRKLVPEVALEHMCSPLLAPVLNEWRRSFGHVNHMRALMCSLAPHAVLHPVPHGCASALQCCSCHPDGAAYDSEDDGLPRGSGFNLEQLYRAVRPSRHLPSLDSSPPNLLPPLRPYQSRAVAWMVQRERGEQGGCGDGRHGEWWTEVQHPLWRQVAAERSHSDVTLHYNPIQWVSASQVYSCPLLLFPLFPHRTCRFPPSFDTKTVAIPPLVARQQLLFPLFPCRNCCYSPTFRTTVSAIPPLTTPDLLLFPLSSTIATQQGPAFALFLLHPRPHPLLPPSLPCVIQRYLCAPPSLQLLCSSVRGGILAEEMGLGKTVEVLACILSHRWGGSGEGETEKGVIGKRAKVVKKGQSEECSERGTKGKKGEDGQKAGEGSRKKREETTGCERTAAQSSNGRGGGVKVVTGEQGEGMEGGEEGCMLTPCGSTLIVCPAAILPQWRDEIVRHTRAGTVSVLVISSPASSGDEGIDRAFRGRRGGKVGDGRKGGRGGGGKGKRQVDWGERERLDVECSEEWEEVDDVTPLDLAAADIVLVSYETLSGDIWHDGPTRVLRHKKRYEARPTPLTLLHWWRVCLDEAQLVEGGTSRAAVMAARLSAQNRWCVSGTPVQKGLPDLQSLLRFLRASPFDEPQWWCDYFEKPIENGCMPAWQSLLALMSQLMWRHNKADLADELALPPQRQLLTVLQFSAIEAHFYRQQHAKCAQRAKHVLRLGERGGERAGTGQGGGGDGDEEEEQGGERQRQQSQSLRSLLLSSACRADLNSFLASLLLLRQACCHPQVGSGGLRRLNSERPMHMDEVWQVCPMHMDEVRQVCPMHMDEVRQVCPMHMDEVRQVCPMHMDEVRQVCPMHMDEVRQVCPMHMDELRQVCPMHMDEVRQVCVLLRSRHVDCQASWVLLEKAHVEAEEAQRLLISALNGLAALHAIHAPTLALRASSSPPSAASPHHSLENINQWGPGAEQAVGFYRDALRVLDGNEDEAREVNGDGDGDEDGNEGGAGGASVSLSAPHRARQRNALLQRLHVLHNPHSLLALLHSAKGGSHGHCGGARSKMGCSSVESGGNGAGAVFGRTAREERLEGEMEEVMGRYVAPYRARAAAAQKAFEDVHSQVEAHGATALLSTSTLRSWHTLLAALQSSAPLIRTGSIISHLERTLLDDDNCSRLETRSMASLALSFPTLRGLLVALGVQVAGLMRGRQQALQRVVEAGSRVEGEALGGSLVAQAGSCARCSAGQEEGGAEDCEAEDGRDEEGGAEGILAGGGGGERGADGGGGTERYGRCLIQLQLSSAPPFLASSSHPTRPLHPTFTAPPAPSHGPIGTSQSTLQVRCTPVDRATAAGRQDTKGRGIRGSKRGGKGGVGEEGERGGSVEWKRADTVRCLAMLPWVLASLPDGIIGDEDRGVLEAAAFHTLEALKTMQNEVRLARAWAKAQRAVLRALHRMQTTTNRAWPLRHVDNPQAASTPVNVARKLTDLNTRLIKDRLAAKAQLEDTRGRLRFLRLLLEERRAEKGKRVADGIGEGKEEGGSGESGMEEREGEEEMCVVCSELLTNKFSVFPCFHVLCRDCTQLLVVRASSVRATTSNITGSVAGSSREPRVQCPMCRREALASEIRDVEDSSRKNRAAFSRSPAASATAAAAAVDANPWLGKGAAAREGEEEMVPDKVQMYEKEMSLCTDYGTKLDAVTRRVLHILHSDASARIIVFSAWKDMLVLIAHCLHANGVPTASAFKPREVPSALERFTSSIRPPALSATGSGVGGSAECRVLLLVTAVGGNGLNVVKAQHVVFVEPGLNAAAEAQAANRVHRIGQTRQTFVHRFIVQDTVEESIHGLNRSKASASHLSTSAASKASAYDLNSLTLEDVSTLFSRG
ncbi:unnamed protein product [Closterium sp. Naga37s-1]|nr:unnamed protein product [Closterium sp. Naga37s-1]